MSSSPYTFRLHQEYDRDLIEQLDAIPKRNRSETIRNALRAFLNGGNSFIPNDIKKGQRINISLSDDDLEGEDKDFEKNLTKTLSFF